MQNRIRVSQIVGDPSKGIPPIIPDGKSTLYRWVTTGQFPPPAVRLPGITWWNLEDIEVWIAEQSHQQGGN
jgi:hypothetical protein